jgi:3-hydroxymyristoyl/3-hydroxydecanoyl-(acyl carrier protein) dehydratase
VLYTHVMRDVFRLQPDVTFGYSLGETSMLWAMGIWQNSDEARTYLHSSPLFDTRLAGRKDAIREAWGLPAHIDDDFWASYVLVASAASVYDQLGHETHVYLTHVNTPTEVVIAGDPAACQRVIERLGCESIRAPFETVIHNEAIMSEYDEFYRLYNQPVNTIDDNITFYSAADYEPMRLDRELVARSVARVSCKQVDFPRLVHRAYRDGARIFIELGPAATCTRWINDTLRAEDREHASMAIDHLRLDDHTALIKMLARLVSHRVPLDLSVLYDDDLPARDGKQLLRTITLGGEPVDSVILSEKNRRRFAGRQSQPVDAQPVMAGQEIPAPALELEAKAAYNSHGALLQDRLAGLRDLGASLQAQVQNPVGLSPVIPAKPAAKVIAPVQPRYTARPALFDTYRIDQFARGSIKACFGPEYAIYDNQRAPRIPNTDLMLISRIVEIDAQRLITKTGSSMVAEYDVPADMWFYTDNSYPFTPYSMLMEMALQPCGFLSAYMGPTLAFPDIDFYFRNLDGQGKMLRDVDLRGRTLVNKVVMTSSTILQGIIIQKFTFDMMLDGESFYAGSSTFGYFTLQALSSQAGLDMGKPPAKWHEANAANLLQMPGNRGTSSANDSYMKLPSRQLAFLDGIIMDVHGGKYGQGYIYATNDVHPSDWFFTCHFHDDPVMPGSLGLEAIIQAVQAYALQAGLGQGLTAPRFAQVENNQTLWKYRGQVLNDSRHVNVEVHIKTVERTGSEINIIADASLWKDTLRIYEFTNVGVRLLDTAND